MPVRSASAQGKTQLVVACACIGNDDCAAVGDSVYARAENATECPIQHYYVRGGIALRSCQCFASHYSVGHPADQENAVWVGAGHTERNERAGVCVGVRCGAGLRWFCLGRGGWRDRTAAAVQPHQELRREKSLSSPRERRHTNELLQAPT